MTPWRRRRERRLAALDDYRFRRRLVDEDLTVLGEQLAKLHVETLTDDLDRPTRADYEHALAAYDRAKHGLAEAEQAQDAAALDRVEAAVGDGRFHRACVLARVQGAAPPVRREPCFFNPQHLPAVADVPWTPPAGVERAVPVCPWCRERLAGGEPPDTRLVRIGDRHVAWWAAPRHRGVVAASLSPVAADAVPPLMR